MKKFNYNISISLREAKELKEVVALADNQILRCIRDVTNKEIDYDILESWYKERDKLKKLPSSEENKIKITSLQNKINDMMFIEDYITVVMENKRHYEYIYNNGIIVNGKKYLRFSCSSSQARVSTVVLCNEEIINALRKKISNDRDLEVPISPSKFNAYFGLAGSSTFLVSEPKFVVVKDFINQDTFKANLVTETDWDIDDVVEEKEVTLDMNRTDGMGLISPTQSEKWAKELGLDWIPSQWCVRQSFLKGMLCTFPIRDFCQEINNGNYIINTIYKDKNGEYIKADLRDYDVIITESQLKLWDSYDSVDKYIKSYQNNKLYWGVTQYTKKEPKDILTLNYQFLQTLNLNQQDIECLCRQFVDWISGVCYSDMAYTLLFLLGVNNTEKSIKNYICSSDNYWIKSLIINPEIRNDKYISKKIYDLIKTKIKNGCLGEIIVDGNFQVIVSDPYAMMQHICGLEVAGLLQKGEFYSNYWNEKEIRQVDAMRSPLTFRAEHMILDLKNNPEVNKWFRYCDQGIILNYFGHEVCHFGGSDFDYDILATTSNPQIIKGVYKDELPVVYNPPKPQKIIFTEDDLYNADTFSFGSIIGSITNKSSIAYALLPNLEKKYGKDSLECKIIFSRLQQCCKAQSAQIDKTKIGKEVKGIPKLWIEKRHINVDAEGNVLDSEDIIKEKELYNSILLNKYPYFFKHRYKHVKRSFNRYYEQKDTTCRQKYRMSLDNLLNLRRKTPDQKDFINNYYDYSPVIFSDSPMNLLCKYIESINFDIKNKIKPDKIEQHIYLYKKNNINYSQELFDQVIVKLNEVLQKKHFDKWFIDLEDRDNIQSEYLIENTLEESLNSLSSNVYEVVNCLVDYFYIHKTSLNKDILWKSYGRYIYKNIKENTDGGFYFPMPNSDGNINYLNKKYSLKELKFIDQL